MLSNSINFLLKANVFQHLFTHINFGDAFNQQLKPGTFICVEAPVDTKIETKVETKIETSVETTQCQGVESIRFGRSYNNSGKPILRGVFPDSLIRLEFGHN